MNLGLRMGLGQTLENCAEERTTQQPTFDALYEAPCDAATMLLRMGRSSGRPARPEKQPLSTRIDDAIHPAKRQKPEGYPFSPYDDGTEHILRDILAQCHSRFRIRKDAEYELEAKTRRGVELHVWLPEVLAKGQVATAYLLAEPDYRTPRRIMNQLRELVKAEYRLRKMGYEWDHYGTHDDHIEYRFSIPMASTDDIKRVVQDFAVLKAYLDC